MIAAIFLAMKVFLTSTTNRQTNKQRKAKKLRPSFYVSRFSIDFDNYKFQDTSYSIPQLNPGCA
jgi:Zn-dependent peptidase ImmA (M78 family)